MHTIENKVINYSTFIKSNTQLYMLFDDKEIITFSKNLKVNKIIESWSEQKEDKLMLFLLRRQKLVFDLIAFIYIGKQEDRGFLCLSLIDFVVNKLNIKAFLHHINSINSLFQLPEKESQILQDIDGTFEKAYHDVQINYIENSLESFFSI